MKKELVCDAKNETEMHNGRRDFSLQVVLYLLWEHFNSANSERKGQTERVFKCINPKRPSHEKNFAFRSPSGKAQRARTAEAQRQSLLLGNSNASCHTGKQKKNKRRRKEFVHYVSKVVSKEGSNTCHSNHTAVEKQKSLGA